MSTAVFQLLISAILFGGMVFAGAVYIRSALVKQRHSELEQLADTRGERIKDLEAQLLRVETRLAQLEGQMHAIQAIKAEEIAMEVARLLEDPHHPVWDRGPS